MKKTVIVMPVANEEDTMQGIIDDVLLLPYDNLYLYPVIDAYSKDKTEQIIRENEKTQKVKCIYNEQSTGVVSCYLYGFKVAIEDGAERIIEMDGGGSHLPSQIPEFINALDDGYDCVWGSRFIEGGILEKQPVYRRILSQGGTLLSNIYLGTRLKDMTSGYEAFTREVLLSMNLDNFLSKGHIYQTEMRFYCRKKKGIEIPIKYVAGESSLKISSVKEAFNVLFKLKENEKYVHMTY